MSFSSIFLHEKKDGAPGGRKSRRAVRKNVNLKNFHTRRHRKSDDKSGEICEAISQTDERIRIFHLNERGGVSKARNIALDKCKGEYVCFVDSDDWIEPDMIEYLYSLLMKNFSYKIAACGIFEMDNSKNRDVSYKIREEAHSENGFLHHCTPDCRSASYYGQRFYRKNDPPEKKLYSFQTGHAMRGLYLRSLM